MSTKEIIRANWNYPTAIRSVQGASGNYLACANPWE